MDEKDRESRTSLTGFRRDRWIEAYMMAVSEGATQEQAFSYADQESRLSGEFY